MVLASFGLFLVLFWVVGFLAARASKKSELDYLIGDKSFGAWAIGLSAGATANSGFIMVGAVGYAYATGFESFLPTLAACIGLWFGWVLYAKRIYNNAGELNALTVPGWMGQYFDQSNGEDARQWLRKFVALAFIVLVGVYALAQFLAASKSLNALFDWSNVLGVCVTAVVVLAYSVTGGIRASIWTDVFQAVVVTLMCVAVAVYAFILAGGFAGMTQAFSVSHPDFLSWKGSLSSGQQLLSMVSFFAMGFGFSLSQPQVLVRLFTGSSEKVVSKATHVMAAYVTLTWLIMVVFGVTARVLLPELADGEQALSVFSLNFLHPIFIGFVIAGVFASIASTIDSQILVSSSALFRDLLPKTYRKLYAKYGMRYWYVATFITGVLIAIAAIIFQGSVFGLIVVAVGILAGIVVPTMMVILHKLNVSTKYMMITMIACAITAVFWTVKGYSGIINEVVPTFMVGFVMIAGYLALNKKKTRQ